MKLFSTSDILPTEIPSTNAPYCETLVLENSYASGNKIGELLPLLLALQDGHSIAFMTDGGWSNIDIIQEILKITGVCSIHFCTWSISIDAIRKFVLWQEIGLIDNLKVLMDQGIRNRKPEILQQAIAGFKNLRLIKCHAKVAVIRNDKYSFSIIGSANMTNNPRKEAGMIIRSEALAKNHINWMEREFANA